MPWPARRAAARLLMAAASSKRLRSRWVAIDHCRALSSSVPEDGLGPIWQYWAQGVDAAPPIVQASMRSIRKHRGTRELIVLDEGTVDQYVELPGHIWDKRERMGRTHFSNFIRLSLLHRYGGTWLDATIMLRAPIPDAVERQTFFVLRSGGRPRLFETWFIHARRGDPLIETVLLGLSDYWRHHNKLHQYFMFAYHFEAALLLHRPLRERFLSMPGVGVHVSHALARLMAEPFDEERHAAILQRTWIHKLTHKFTRPNVPDQLLYDRLLEDWPEQVPLATG